MATISMAAARVLRTGDSEDWTPEDCLREILRRMESGEIEWKRVLVIGVIETDDQDTYSRETWRANMSRSQEALQLLLAQRALIE